MTRRTRAVGYRGIADVDHFEVVEGVSVRGATEKDVLLDPETGHWYIAKLGGRHNDIEVGTEFAIYVVGRSLGVFVADARIARYRGRVRFLSRYFLDRTAAEELVHGMQLFRELYDDDTVSNVLKDEQREQDLFSIQAVKAAFGAHYIDYGPGVEEKLFGGFVAMLTHDALLGVQDRHHENWGVVVQRERGAQPPRFAPLYDSARGLFCNLTDELIRKSFHCSNGPNWLGHYVNRARPLVGCTGLTPTNDRRYVTHLELIAAVYDRYPEQRTIVRTIVESFDWRRVHAELREELGVLFSPQRLDLMRICLHKRQKAVLAAIDGQTSTADILG